MTPEEYQLGVLQTASADWKKIGQHIVKPDGEAVPSTLNFMHAAMGIGSEIGEMIDKVDTNNLLEEIGDALWYTALGFYVFGRVLNVPQLDDRDHLVFDEELFEAHCLQLISHNSELLSIAKAGVFYGRDFDVEEALTNLSFISEILFELAWRLGETPSSVMERNNRKLLDKQKGRYKDGQFTENDANERNLDDERSVMENVK